MMSEALDKSFHELKKNLDMMPETTDRMLKATNQRSAGLEQDARQPRLTLEADVTSDKKTRKRTEDAAADRVMSGDSSSAQVDPNPMYLTSFGDDSNFGDYSTEPPALPC